MSGLIPESEPGNTTNRRKLAAAVLTGALWLLLAGVAVLGPSLSPYDPHQTNPRDQFAAPGAAHWLGSDELGRDILSRYLWGARSSLGGAILASSVAAVLGGLISLFALLNYQRLDQVVGYVLDVMLAFPGLLVALIVVTVLGQGPLQVSLAVGIALSPTFARMMRGSIATVRGQPYVTASYALGANRWWVVTKHILRNIAPPMLSIAAVILAWALLDCASLEFLGLAGSAENPTWGNMIGEGRAYFHEAVWWVAAPSISVCLSVLSLTLLGNLRRLLSRAERA